MTDKATIIKALSCNLCFTSSKNSAARLLKKIPDLPGKRDNGCWLFGDQPSVKVYPTGHIVFYNDEGRRFLFTDPEGHPLHECEWIKDAKGGYKLAFLRMQLDSRQWLGIKPQAKTFSSRLDLRGAPEGKSASLDDLRRKAAEAWKVPFSEVKYFYRDENFSQLGDGVFDIHLTKDGLYALPDGRFDNPLFISWMFSLNWANLDLIPVVELFQSALPGSGGAVFEFIWGLFDDQSQETRLAPLRYRGLPTYPAKEAFNIFSAFFVPTGPQGEDIMDVFMDTGRSHEITWLPRKDPPWRYFSEKHQLCLTVQDHFLYKAVIHNDPAAIPFINRARGARASCQREIQVNEKAILLLDADVRREIPLEPAWQITPDPVVPQGQYPFSWKRFFKDTPPQTDPVKAIFTLPFYPEGADEIEESTVQPMALDQMFYYMELCPDMPDKLQKSRRVLIHTLDAVISGCIDCTAEREYTVLYDSAEFAQKNAQLLWDYAASRDQLPALAKVNFLKESDHVESAYRESYDLIFKWIPFLYYQEKAICEQILRSLVSALNPGGLLFLAGPAPIVGLLEHYGLKNLYCDAVMDMPFFHQHRKMCPENRVNPSLTVFLAEKRA
jgi:hypothetical protein